MNRNEYLEERRLIFKVLDLFANKVGLGFVIFALAIAAIHLFFSIVSSEDSVEGVFCTAAVVMLIISVGLPLALAGTSSFAGKPVSYDTLGIKGAQNQLGAFLCMPIKRESVFRLQFEIFMMCMISISMVFAGSALQNAKAGEGFFIPNLVLMIIIYGNLTILFMLVYSSIFVSYRKRRLINGMYLASMILLMVRFYIMMMYEAFSDVANFPDFWSAGGTAGNVVIIVLSVLYPIVMYNVYKNIVLRKKGAAWYE